MAKLNSEMASSSLTYSLAKIAQHLKQFDLEVEIVGDQTAQVSRVETLATARSGSISFISDPKYLEFLATSQASAVFLKPEHASSCKTNAVLVANPYAAYAITAQLIYNQPAQAGIASSASIATSAKLGAGVEIGENAVIAEEVEIGDNCVISAGCFIGKGSKLGANTKLEANVTIMQDCVLGKNCLIKSGAVIGGDGFGFAKHQGKWFKIPQIGRVIIGDSVYIGNNSTIDRGALEDTVIGDNSILDNLVHIAHNVKLGAGTAIAAQTGLSGSTIVGKNCTFAGQTASVGHLEIADGVTLMGRAVASNNIKDAGAYAGFPAIPFADWKRNAVYTNNLAKLASKIKELTKRLNKFDNN